MQQVEVNQKKETHSNIPHNIEAEQSLIGSVLVNNEILDEISNIVNASKFYDPVHVKIFETIENLNAKGMIANPITLKNFFENDGGLNDVGGVEYLIKLTRFSSSVKQAVDYSKIIHENYIKRQLINISEEIKYDSVNVKDDKTSEIIIEEAEKSLYDLAERGNFSQTFIKFNQALDETIKMATNEEVKMPKQMRGILDKKEKYDILENNTSDVKNYILGKLS